MAGLWGTGGERDLLPTKEPVLSEEEGMDQLTQSARSGGGAYGSHLGPQTHIVHNMDFIYKFV